MKFLLFTQTIWWYLLNSKNDDNSNLLNPNSPLSQENENGSRLGIPIASPKWIYFTQ